MDPPSYASSSAPSTALAESDEAPFLVNLVPTAPGPPASASAALGGGRSDGVSFQHGHLGAGPSSLQGEIQIKLLASADSAPPITKIEVVFRGVERSRSQPRGRSRSHLSDPTAAEYELPPSSTTEIELAETKTTLWERPNAGSPGPRQPPGVMPFKIDLTPDLPHCVHPGRSRGGLEYELEAKVHCGAAVASTGIRGTPTCVGVKAPVHLVRYSKRGEALAPPPSFAGDGPSAPVLGRTQISAHSPTPVSVTMSKTLLRRGEPLGLKVRIPPPAQELVQDKGLKLRSVSAELHRHVRVRGVEQPATEDEADETSTAVEQDSMPVEAPPYAHESEPQAAAGSTSTPTTDGKARPDSPMPSGDDLVVEQTTVLAFSGKSCRFSPSRPVVLHLALYPSHAHSVPAAFAAAAAVAGASNSPPRAHAHSISGGEAPMRRDHRLATASSADCESITQATILHDVDFSVVVTVQIVGRSGERHDVVLESALGIVPDWAPLPEKAREAEDDVAVSGHDGRVGFAGPRSAAGDVDAMDAEGELESAPAPLYAEMHLEDAARAASASSSSQMPSLWEGTSRAPFGAPPDEEGDEDGEDEYDGYEDFSALAGTSGPAPPTIDEDEPPPPAPDAPPEGLDLHQPNPTLFHESDDMSGGEDSDSDGDSSADSSPVLTSANGSDQGFAFVPLDRFGSSGPARRSITPPPPASPPPPLEDQPGRVSLVSPPAYAGWSTSAVDADASRADAGPPPPISPLDHTDLTRESNPARRLSSPTRAGQALHHHHHHRHGAQAAPPPPYAAEFGVLPPGMIGVARPDNGEIGGFLVRR